MKTTMTAAPAATESYATAYARLTTIAEKLKGAGATADLDGLVRDLREARALHLVLRSRLDAIRREVDAEVDATGETAEG